MWRFKEMSSVVLLCVGAACGAEETEPEMTTGGLEPNTEASSLDDRGYVSSARLVTTDWVQERLEDPSVLLIDLRPREEYDAGHIPGGAHLPAKETFQADDARGVPGMLPVSAHIADALGSIGATPETTLVFYDDAQSLWSARAIWALSVYKHADARLMDGAWKLWKVEGRPTSDTAPTNNPSEYAFRDPPDTSIVATWSDVVASIENPETLVCDARSAAEYEGESVRAARSGHVPGSILVEWSQAVSETGEFLPADELRSLYDSAGVTGDHVTLTLCQSGVRAAHTWFVLTDLLGYGDVRMYDGSWVEYGNREDSPIAN
jgi:thiosulfate/3-mercaptopyruvate sulfurtransferase